MAEIKPRINFEGRTALEKVIPLSTPYLIFVDPSDLCNGKCSWCPSSNPKLLKEVGRHPQLMDYSLYCKIINDLSEFPEPIKTLRLYKDGEPLLNPSLPAMIAYAKLSERFGQIDTTTNGMLLTYELSRKIIGAGLNKIFISVPEYYRDIPEYMTNIAYLHGFGGDERCHVHAKIIGDGLSEDAKKRFYDDFDSRCDSMFIENLSPCWPQFDVEGVNKEKGIYQQPITKPVIVCPYIFYSTAINSDGTVSLCFLDWRHDMIIGDLKHESIKELWNGPLMRHIRVDHLRGYKMKVATNCIHCGQLSYGAPDNIDAYAQDILRRL